MVELSSDLLCLFSAPLSEDDETVLVEVPRREVDTGAVTPGEAYRVALMTTDSGPRETGAASTSAPPGEPQPPVEPGEIRYVEIEDIGKQGDGIARVERGYVIIVPETAVGDRVKIEIAEVKSNFAVGERIEAA